MSKSKSIYRIITLTLIAIITTITFVLASNQISKTAQKTEIRGVWITNIDSEVLFSSSGIKAAINRLANVAWSNSYMNRHGVMSEHNFAATIQDICYYGEDFR